VQVKVRHDDLSLFLQRYFGFVRGVCGRSALLKTDIARFLIGLEDRDLTATRWL
jgi:hypothetical protein